MADAGSGAPRGEHYEEAIAGWHLRVQTAVKKSSSLPTAMFDACDPNLEARLGEITEGLFARLLDQSIPDQELADENKLHREDVGPEELRRVWRQFLPAVRVAAPALDEHLDQEYLGILVDTCTGDAAEARPHAAARLARDFHVGDRHDLDALTALLAQSLRALLPAGATAAPAETALDALAATCERLAAAVAQEVARIDPRQVGS